MTVTVQEAESNLGELISRLRPGQELTIVQDEQPLATLTRAPRATWPCKAGSAKDKILWIAPDFDSPLEDFREYTE